jgi:hypothetical protein
MMRDPAHGRKSQGGDKKALERVGIFAMDAQTSVWPNHGEIAAIAEMDDVPSLD